MIVPNVSNLSTTKFVLDISAMFVPKNFKTILVHPVSLCTSPFWTYSGKHRKLVYYEQGSCRSVIEMKPFLLLSSFSPTLACLFLITIILYIFEPVAVCFLTKCFEEFSGDSTHAFNYVSHDLMEKLTYIFMLESRQYFDFSQCSLAIRLMLERWYLLNGDFRFRYSIVSRSGR